jgi:hypothetical protein
MDDDSNPIGQGWQPPVAVGEPGSAPVAVHGRIEGNVQDLQVTVVTKVAIRGCVGRSTTRCQFPTFRYESCAGTAKLGRFNVYYAGGSGCSRWAFTATYWWPDSHTDKWHANYCVDGTDHWTPVFALHIAQLTLDGTGGLNGQQGIPPRNTVIDWGLYK